MKKISILAIAFGLSLSLASCGGSSKDSSSKTDDQAASNSPTDIHHKVADFVDLDLHSSGLPAKMKAPKGATLKKANDGSVYVQAGKYFQMTLKVNQTSLSEEYIKGFRDIANDKDFNPSFEKFAYDEPNGFMKVNKGGEHSFMWAAPAENGCLVATNGVEYSVVIDGQTEQQPDDIKIMWEAAKTIVIE